MAMAIGLCKIKCITKIVLHRHGAWGGKIWSYKGQIVAIFIRIIAKYYNIKLKLILQYLIQDA